MTVATVARTTVGAAVLQVCRRVLGAVADGDPVPTLEALADEVGRSPDQLRRDVQRIVGLSPKELADAARADRVRDALRTSPSVGEAVHDAGLTSSSRLYRLTDATLGMDPSTWAAGGDGEVVVWTAFDSDLGRVAVAATDRGLVAVLFSEPDATHDSDEAADADLEAEIRRRLPAASLVRDDVWLAGWRAVLAAHVEQPGREVELPLDLHGTAFQLRVWAALRRIPAGTTVTYKELADAVGSPKGNRAVAGACGANHVSVVVPCHRVVRSDGSLSGYRWGVERKATLLARESSRLV